MAGRCVLIVAALLFSFTHAYPRFDQAAPVLKMAGKTVSNNGHVKLQWKVTRQGQAVEVQQASDQNFESARTVYRGLEEGTFISGLPDGNYYYRVRHIGGAWSDAVLLTVKHHSLRSALVLFALGAIVFALTAFIVIKGALNTSVD